MHRRTALLLIAVPLLPQAAHARQQASLAPSARVGEPVRVRIADKADLRGTLAYSSLDSVVVTDGDGARRAVRAELVSAMYARRVMPWQQRGRRGALVGGVLGFVIPAVQSLAKGKHCDAPVEGYDTTYCRKQYDNIDETAGLGLVFYSIIGFGVGASIPFHHWERVNFVPIALSPK